MESAARFPTRPTRDKLQQQFLLRAPTLYPFNSSIRTTLKQDSMPYFSNCTKTNPPLRRDKLRSSRVPVPIRALPTLAPRRSTTEHAMQTRQTFESDARRCKARCRYRKCCCGVVFHTVVRAAPSGGPWTVPRIACHSLCEPGPRSAGRGLRRRHDLFRAKCRG